MQKVITKLIVCAVMVNTIFLTMGKNLKAEQSWSGKISNTKKGMIPKGDIINDKDTFSKIWKEWTGNQQVPEINFSKYLIYVNCVDANDPNRQAARFMVNKGVLKVMIMSTRMGFQNDGKNSKFTMYKIASAGIKGLESFQKVNGRYKRIITPINGNAEELKVATDDPDAKVKKSRLAEIDAYSKKWKKESAKHKAGYTYSVIRFGGMLPSETTTIKVVNGKVVSRMVTSLSNALVAPGQEANNNKLVETGDAINKSKKGARAKTMEQLIVDSKKTILKYNSKRDRIYFKIIDFKVNCIITPKMIADHPGNGVSMSRFKWNK